MGILPSLLFTPAQCVITQLHFITFEVLRPQNVFTYPHDGLHHFMHTATGYLTTQLRMYEQQLSATEFTYKVNLWHKALGDMIDRLYEYGRCTRKHQECSVFYKQCMQPLIQVKEEVERYWCDECKADYRLTNVQLNELKPVIRRQWNEIKQQLHGTCISQQLVLIVSEPVMSLVLTGSRVKKSTVAYWLELMDAMACLIASGKADTAALVWLLIRYNFNARTFIEYCIKLVEEDLCSRETPNDKLCLLVWLQSQGAYLNLFDHAAWKPAAASVKEVLDTWLQLKINEYGTQLTTEEIDRWHILTNAGVATLLCHAMHETDFLKGTIAQSFSKISRTCRLVKTAAPTVAYLEKEFYSGKPAAKRDLVMWLYKWLHFLENM